MTKKEATIKHLKEKLEKESGKKVVLKEDVSSKKTIEYYKSLFDKLHDLDDIIGYELRKKEGDRDIKKLQAVEKELTVVEKQLNNFGLMNGDQVLSPEDVSDVVKKRILKHYDLNYT